MHETFMTAALEQAYLGQGQCAPNPCVGAIIVKNGFIISAGWHQGVGTPHAEQMVIEQLAGDLDQVNVNNCILYVTLEPCNHWGRTPPCLAAIITSGIGTVVYGFKDPNPIVMLNDTPKQLHDAGINVIYFPTPEINAFYQSYYYWTQTKKPFVTAKLAQSLDGKIAGIDGAPVKLSNQACSEFTHQHRQATDIILTTARTILNDDPTFNARINGQVTKKVLAIIDTHLSLTPDAKIFDHAQYCHIYHDERYQIKHKHQHRCYHPLPSVNQQLDLIALINHLGELGYHDVWVEAGGRLFSAMHVQKLVQRTYLYIVPVLLGDNAVAGYHESNFFSHAHTISWQPKADNIIACVQWQEQTCLPV